MNWIVQTRGPLDGTVIQGMYDAEEVSGQLRRLFPGSDVESFTDEFHVRKNRRRIARVIPLGHKYVPGTRVSWIAELKDRRWLRESGVVIACQGDRLVVAVDYGAPEMVLVEHVRLLDTEELTKWSEDLVAKSQKEMPDATDW